MNTPLKCPYSNTNLPEFLIKRDTILRTELKFQEKHSSEYNKNHPKVAKS